MTVTNRYHSDEGELSIEHVPCPRRMGLGGNRHQEDEEDLPLGEQGGGSE